MALQCGIVGLPNVGKSTLFNCLSNAKAQAANFPFCTIEPNVGVITVPAECAQEVADLMVGWGIKAIWNFTPARLKVPGNIAVQNTTIYTNLAILFNKLHSSE